MRRRIIAGNWKMNNDQQTTKKFCEEIIPLVKDVKHEIIVCPPFTSIEIALEELKDTKINVGAQNMYYKDDGAYTGEISPLMLKELGVNYVIIGHSDRRQIFKENDEDINQKVKKALEIGLTPILCFGEDADEKNDGKTQEVITTQLSKNLEGINSEQMVEVILAYEPIWAISRGDPNHKSATPDDAQQMHKTIRNFLEKMFDKDTAQNTTILYGGSMKPENTTELNNKPDIDGGLVGGASLTAEKFAKTIIF